MGSTVDTNVGPLPARPRNAGRRNALIVNLWIGLCITAWIGLLQLLQSPDWSEEFNRLRLSFVYEEDVEKFSQISSGMTRFQVEAIAGEPGEAVREQERLLKLMEAYDTPRSRIDNYALIFSGNQGLICVVYFSQDETVASVFLAGS